MTLIDATKLAVERTVTLSRPSGAIERLLTSLGLASHRAAAKSLDGVLREASFSADGKALYVWGETDSTTNTSGMQGLGLERIDLARGRVTAQTLSDGLFQQVKPSLDGESLYVLGFTSSSNPNEPVSRSIWRLDARTLQTKASRPVDNVYSFALATGNPDNNQRAAGQVAFASDQSGVFQIYTVNADGKVSDN